MRAKNHTNSEMTVKPYSLTGRVNGTVAA